MDSNRASFERFNHKTKTRKSVHKLYRFVRLAIVHFPVIFLVGIYSVCRIKTRSAGLVIDQNSTIPNI